MKIKRLTIITVVIFFAIILVGLAGMWLWGTKPTGVGETIVESNGSVNQFAYSLANKGLIHSPIMFRLQWGNDALQEGYYSLSGESVEDIIAKIKQGPNVVKVTIPEGFSSGQVAQRLGKNGFDADGFYELAQSEEGYLFPDTYFFVNDSTVDELLQNFKDVYLSRTDGLEISSEDLILASIVEREAQNDEERAKIAAVYKNRIDQDMNLEADPTVQYGRDLALIKSEGLVDTQLWEPLEAGQTKSINSPYNTYLNAGLPPGPICNPGLKSIEAALDPEPNFDYLFFFHDGNGEIHFSKTFVEHQDLIEQYGL